MSFSSMKFFQLIISASFFVVGTSFSLSHNSASTIGALSTNNDRRLRTSSLHSSVIRSLDVEENNLKFTICGGGAFSLAMAKVLSHKNISVNLLVRNQTVADLINENHFHPKYLTECPLPSQLFATSDPETGFKDADYIIHAVPCQQSRKFLTNMKPFMPPNAPIMSVTKGVEDGTFCLMSDIVEETMGKERRSAYLSGPSFAREIMNEYATVVVIASEDGLSSELSTIIGSPYFRCHTTRDVKGLELGGAVKNVIALAAGMCEGLGLGMNSMSGLVTSGCQEMASMGELFGGNFETFNGLSGVGDTFATCMEPLSRNRKVGVRLAQGESLAHVLDTSDTTEGVATSIALHELLKTKVDPKIVDFKFPIISGVAAVLKGDISPAYVLGRLMQYPVRDENRN